MGDNANPLDTAEYFVRQQYVDVLGREPDEVRVQLLERQDSRLRRGRAVCEHATARGGGGLLYLGREPGFGRVHLRCVRRSPGSPTCIRRILNGSHPRSRWRDTRRRQDGLRPKLRATCGVHDEVPERHSADSFVDALLQNVQATGADLSSERTNLVAIYGQGTDQLSSRAAVVSSLADNATFKQSQYNPAFVLTEYFAYLRRDAESTGFNFWVGVLTTGDAGNYRGMVCSFVTSTEYQNRFSTVVSHGNGECGR